MKNWAYVVDPLVDANYKNVTKRLFAYSDYEDETVVKERDNFIFAHQKARSCNKILMTKTKGKHLTCV